MNAQLFLLLHSIRRVLLVRASLSINLVPSLAYFGVVPRNFTKLYISHEALQRNFVK